MMPLFCDCLFRFVPKFPPPFPRVPFFSSEWFPYFLMSGRSGDERHLPKVLVRSLYCGNSFLLLFPPPFHLYTTPPWVAIADSSSHIQYPLLLHSRIFLIFPSRCLLQQLIIPLSFQTSLMCFPSAPPFFPATCIHFGKYAKYVLQRLDLLFLRPSPRMTRSSLFHVAIFFLRVPPLERYPSTQCCCLNLPQFT